MFENKDAAYVSGTHDGEVWRILEEDAPRAPYRRRKDEVKSVIHWGQRKLLVAEIEFLTMYAGTRKSDTPQPVVYAGAAPGKRNIISLHFPATNN